MLLLCECVCRMSVYEYPEAELERALCKLKSAAKNMKHEDRKQHNTFEQLRLAVRLGAPTPDIQQMFKGYNKKGLSRSYYDDKTYEERDPIALYAIDNANQYGNLRVLELLIKRGLCVVPSEDGQGANFNSLVYAATVGQDDDYALATVKLLLLALQRDTYAIYGLNSSWRNVTPLMAAARRGSVKLVQLFLEAGACASQEDSALKRRNALYHAHYHGHDACARLIEAAMEREHLAEPAAALERAKEGLECAKAKLAFSIAETKKIAISAADNNPLEVFNKELKRKREAEEAKKLEDA